MAGILDAYASEIYSQYIEGGVGGTLEDAAQSAHKRIRTIVLHRLQHHASCTTSRQRFHDGGRQGAYEIGIQAALFYRPRNALNHHIHPQRVVHSAVQFVDGAVKAQLGVPDMRLPIQYAFSFPQRLHLNGDRLDLFKTQDLQFFKPDYQKFKCLQLAFDAIRKGGNMSCIVNAANEIVNAGFRKGECGFLQMADIIEETMAKATFDSNPDLDVYLQTDAEARRIATELMLK